MSRVDVKGPAECWPWKGGVALSGYGLFSIGGTRKHALAHREAWERHHGRSAEGGVIMHLCDNRICCNPAHLRLGSLAENNDDMFAKGRHCFGVAHPGAKLTDDDVRRIRRSPDRSADVAAAFGISDSLVRRIRRREAWRHVDG